MASPNYSAAHVIRLFDEMAQTYGAVNLISSFGFSHLWRRAAVNGLEITSEHVCADLMCGMGEATDLMLRGSGLSLAVTAVDFCPEMTKRCSSNLHRRGALRVEIETRNVLDLADSPRYDRICSSFGLKTLDNQQHGHFASLVAGLLKPGGRAAFVEIHVPRNPFLRSPYLFYIRHVIPTIGRLCLGNPACYRHLATYTEDFAQRDHFAENLHLAGLKIETRSLFFGCAKLYLAQKVPG